MNLEQNGAIIVLISVLALQLITIPLLAFMAKSYLNSLHELESKMSIIERIYVDRDSCFKRHDALEAKINNGLRGDIAHLRERVLVMETKKGTAPE